MKKTLIHIIVLIAVLSCTLSCNDEKAAAEMRRRATELAMQRTDSVAKIQADSLDNVRINERRKADSIARIDSIRRIYERNHITLEGTVGGQSASLRLSRSGDAVSGTYRCGGLNVNVRGTWNDGVVASGKLMHDSLSSTKVNINLQRSGENEFAGSVTVNKDGAASTQRAVLQRY